MPRRRGAEAQKLQNIMEDTELNFKSFEQRLAITYTLDGLQTVAQAWPESGAKVADLGERGFPFSVEPATRCNWLPPAGHVVCCRSTSARGSC